jgi:hypothetical protein
MAPARGALEEKFVVSSTLNGQAPGWLRCALLVLAIIGVVGLSACGSDVPIEQKYPTDRYPGDSKPRYGPPENTIFGPGGIFGNSDQANKDQNGGGIGVNSLLWRASLDTLSFMPLTSADPFGGVIITDWYTPPSTPNERFKVTLYILGRELRADGIRASVFHQTNPGSGWADAPVAPTTATDLENAILARARQMRVAGVQQ